MKQMKQVKSNFRLEKHYLDCIDEDGNCFIIYQADLEYYFIRFAYSDLVSPSLQVRIFRNPTGALPI